jgi:DNA-binding response OmpR family regulator
MREATNGILIVESDLELARALGAALSEGGTRRVWYAQTLDEGIRELARAPELLVTELCLDGGDCLPLLRAARRLMQAPLIATMSAEASRELVAQAMLEGGEVYFEKPLRPEVVQQRLSGLRSDAPAACRRLARLLVGRVGLKQAQEQLRSSMNLEALERTGGSRRAAAHLLGVDRRYVQRLVQKFSGRNPRPTPELTTLVTADQN